VLSPIGKGVIASANLILTDVKTSCPPMALSLPLKGTSHVQAGSSWTIYSIELRYESWRRHIQAFPALVSRPTSKKSPCREFSPGNCGKSRPSLIQIKAVKISSRIF